jgi:hypothetical protein
VAAPSGTAISASDISKIENGGEYYLTSTGSTQSTINISRDTTLDLNGHGVYYKGAGNNPTFIFVKNGAKLTIKNSKEGSPTRTLADSALSKFGNAAVLAFGNGGDTPTSLKY